MNMTRTNFSIVFHAMDGCMATRGEKCHRRIDKLQFKQEDHVIYVTMLHRVEHLIYIYTKMHLDNLYNILSTSLLTF